MEGLACDRFGMALCNIGARFYPLYFATTLATTSPTKTTVTVRPTGTLKSVERLFKALRLQVEAACA
eukprot:2464995-Rhodomonas_salina.1